MVYMQPFVPTLILNEAIQKFCQLPLAYLVITRGPSLIPRLFSLPTHEPWNKAIDDLTCGPSSELWTHL